MMVKRAIIDKNGIVSMLFIESDFAAISLKTGSKSATKPKATTNAKKDSKIHSEKN